MQQHAAPSPFCSQRSPAKSAICIIYKEIYSQLHTNTYKSVCSFVHTFMHICQCHGYAAILRFAHAAVTQNLLHVHEPEYMYVLQQTMHAATNEYVLQ